ncbi:hypothetical protein BU24DRAFT_464219 [Aaosphaeria arxii CBS 175.79]|uniref:Pal1-domain-containing protein n=1 Tax=Aaosphaeria arxii CBS 175.79 TaxID=1450172 RepID=A0A6A5XKV0_9PLEO|nr:uncharacterized protein BU24DRAFT_464219 [Aaosphaeria arxii CBS 175.79]KAF2013437.1 hypothetical protein BU24DRAFT_464219 [Aaosphaeria arxii CBS 175.79]
MSTSKGAVQAQHELIDPLIEPDPSDETGLNSHFRSTFAPAPHQRQTQLPTPPHSAGLQDKTPSASIREHHTGSTVETNPFRRSTASSPSHRHHHHQSKPSNGFNDHQSRRYDGPSPPYSPQPPRSSHPSGHRHTQSHSASQFTSDHRALAFGSMNESRPRRSSQPSSTNVPFREGGGLGRSTSLRERYPGDMSHRPLDTIRKDTTRAHRAYHLRKKNFQGTDTIDRLDDSTFSYHHEGPFDAANLARNKDWKHSPVAAVQSSNEEALRATPRENIVDALTKHRPLEGTANMPPGVPDKLGRVLHYEEGTDLHREPGVNAYKRWPGMDYHPEDLKGKGEPNFTIDNAMKNKKIYGETGSEMQTRRRNQSVGTADLAPTVPIHTGYDRDGDLGRSNSVGKGVGHALKKRFGSLRRRKEQAA